MFGSSNSLLNTRENENLSINSLSRIARHNTYMRLYNEAIYDVNYNQIALSLSIDRLKNIENSILNYLEDFNLNGRANTQTTQTTQTNNQSNVNRNTEPISSSTNTSMSRETNSTRFSSATNENNTNSTPLSTSYASSLYSRDSETMRNLVNSIVNIDNRIINSGNRTNSLNSTSNRSNTSNTARNTSSLSSLFPVESSPLIYFLLQRTYEDEDTTPPPPMEEVITNCIYSDLISPINTTCPIRLEPFEPSTEVSVINNCGHIFTRSYLNRWYETNQTCPMCRKPMLPESSETNSSTSSQSTEDSP